MLGATFGLAEGWCSDTALSFSLAMEARSAWLHGYVDEQHDNLQQAMVR
jgi:ribosome modulation factor